LSNQTADIAGKRVELLRELAHQVRRLAIMVKSDNASAASEMRGVKAAAGTLDIEAVPLEIAQAEPLSARAQQTAKVPTIGYLGTAAAAAWAPWTTAFVRRLRDLGWIEGRTVAIQYRWADGRSERWAEFAAEFVRLQVDVIVSGGNAAVAAKQASTAIPIVFTMVDDPVGTGLVASLARPGGNVTGLAMQSIDLVGK
jgi:ABC-type uncharacterized transport system substrate-binding protein